MPRKHLCESVLKRRGAGADPSRVRRSGAIVVGATAVVVAVMAALAPGAAAADTGVPKDDPSRGLRYRGLTRAPADSACRGNFEFHAAGRLRCTHGPDPVPTGRTVNANPPSDTTQRSTASARPSSVPCVGDGTSGARVRAIYAHLPGDDNYATTVASIRQWAADVDNAVSASAAATGGIRHVRWRTDAGCVLHVDNVTVSSAAVNDFGTTVDELTRQGYDAAGTKYLVWMDANVLCGIAEVFPDDRADGALNWNNGRVPMYARTDRGCWGLNSFDRPVEAHELVHTLGSVQNSAPHHNTSGHCYDGADLMCQRQAAADPVELQLCPAAHIRLLDCNNDDYFNTAPAHGSYLATHWNTADSAFLDSGGAAGDVEGRFVPVPPARIYDSRPSEGGPGALGQQETRAIQVAGKGGAPADGVSGVVANVTITNPTAGSLVTVFPTGVAKPTVSNLNFGPGATKANLVTVKVGTDGWINVHNDWGTVDVIVDVAGWYAKADAPKPAGGTFQALTPARIFDTRPTEGGAGALGPQETRAVKVAGVGGVPASGVGAVVMNVTATDATEGSLLTVFPSDAAKPNVSNVNFGPGQTIPNLVVVKVGADGFVKVSNDWGATHVIFDVAGWFANDAGSAPNRFLAIPPTRIFDSRNDSSRPIGPHETWGVRIAGLAGLPTSGVSAVVVNVTVTSPTAGSLLTLFPSGAAKPVVSNLNFGPGQTVSNLVTVKVGNDGYVNVQNDWGTAEVIVDIAGWYGPNLI